MQELSAALAKSGAAHVFVQANANLRVAIHEAMRIAKVMDLNYMIHAKPGQVIISVSDDDSLDNQFQLRALKTDDGSEVRYWLRNQSGEKFLERKSKSDVEDAAIEHLTEFFTLVHSACK